MLSNKGVVSMFDCLTDFLSGPKIELFSIFILIQIFVIISTTLRLTLTFSKNKTVKFICRYLLITHQIHKQLIFQTSDSQHPFGAPHSADQYTNILVAIRHRRIHILSSLDFSGKH